MMRLVAAAWLYVYKLRQMYAHTHTEMFDKCLQIMSMGVLSLLLFYRRK